MEFKTRMTGACGDYVEITVKDGGTIMTSPWMDWDEAQYMLDQLKEAVEDIMRLKPEEGPKP